MLFENNTLFFIEIFQKKERIFYESLMEMVSLVYEYLKNQLIPMAMGDKFSCVMENLQYGAIIVGVGLSWWTHRKTKNQEIYAKLLGEVYAPLYSYLVRQELVRQMSEMKGNYHDTPILEYVSKITKTTQSDSGVSTDYN